MSETLERIRQQAELESQKSLRNMCALDQTPIWLETRFFDGQKAVIASGGPVMVVSRTDPTGMVECQFYNRDDGTFHTVTIHQKCLRKPSLFQRLFGP